MAGKQGLDGWAVLWEPGDEVQELDVPGNLESSGGGGNLGTAGNFSGFKEGRLEPPKGLPRANSRGWRGPAGLERSGELGSFSNPLWNARETWEGGNEIVEGQRNGEMVGETSAVVGMGPVVGGVGENGDVSSDEGAGKEGGRDEETVETGGPGVGRLGLE